MTGSVTVTTIDKTALLKGLVTTLEKRSVYVGIPAEKAVRRGGPVNNAALLFLHTNGSPIRHLPKRPVLEPAIEAHKDEIATEMGLAAQAHLDQLNTAAQTGTMPSDSNVTRHLKRAGMRGMNAARSWFTDPRNNWAPDAPATIRRKLRKRYTMRGTLRKKGRHETDLPLLLSDAIKGGAGIDTPLIDTGQMRRSIVFFLGPE